MSPWGQVSAADIGRRLTITPESAGWRTLSVDVVHLDAGGEESFGARPLEGALVVLEGTVRFDLDGPEGVTSYAVSRADVFSEPGSVVYAPPGYHVRVTADAGPASLSAGWAPADPGYPVRLVGPEESRAEHRGGGTARRQVRHLLSHPLPAHRLVVYEVHVPGGGWSGWPPHRHDGVDGSPYLEESYYFRFSRPEGFGLHCNYATDPAPEDLFAVRDGDLVLVPGGYHFSSGSPGGDMYFLNFLAGDLEHADRREPPCFDPRHVWIDEVWKGAGPA